MADASTSRAKVGSYRLLFELATGGMGVVELALHRAAGGFERLVIVKRIHRHLLATREIVDMLVDEARLASQIRHPNVVPVDDVVDAGGELLLVQPYVESVTLSRLIEAATAAGEVLEAPVVARVLADVLAGLDAAHRAVDLRGRPLEIVHRDVSPHNVLVGKDGCARVIDFGIAKAARRITVTEAGTLKGKIGYMAPEQLRRVPVDARADVFSAGVVLYEALTGARPFEGADEGDTLLSILMGEPPPPSSRVPALGPEVDAIVEKALATDRGDRYESAADMRDALDRAVSLASPREVAAVVQRLCASDLATLHERVQEALGARASSVPAEPVEPPPRAEGSLEVAGRTSTIHADAGLPRPLTRTIVAVSVVGALALLAAAAWRTAPARGLAASADRGPVASSSGAPPNVEVAATVATTALATSTANASAGAGPGAPVASGASGASGALAGPPPATPREPAHVATRPRGELKPPSPASSTSELHPSPYSRAP